MVNASSLVRMLVSDNSKDRGCFRKLPRRRIDAPRHSPLTVEAVQGRADLVGQRDPPLFSLIRAKALAAEPEARQVVEERQ